MLTFTEEIINRKLFFCAVSGTKLCVHPKHKTVTTQNFRNLTIEQKTKLIHFSIHTFSHYRNTVKSCKNWEIRFPGNYFKLLNFPIKQNFLFVQSQVNSFYLLLSFDKNKGWNSWKKINKFLQRLTKSKLMKNCF